MLAVMNSSLIRLKKHSTKQKVCLLLETKPRTSEVMDLCGEPTTNNLLHLHNP